jgi:hypothetical protein
MLHNSGVQCGVVWHKYLYLGNATLTGTIIYKFASAYTVPNNGY